MLGGALESPLTRAKSSLAQVALRPNVRRADTSRNPGGLRLVSAHWLCYPICMAAVVPGGQERAARDACFCVTPTNVNVRRRSLRNLEVLGPDVACHNNSRPADEVDAEEQRPAAPRVATAWVLARSRDVGRCWKPPAYELGKRTTECKVSVEYLRSSRVT